MHKVHTLIRSQEYFIITEERNYKLGSYRKIIQLLIHNTEKRERERETETETETDRQAETKTETDRETQTCTHTHTHTHTHIHTHIHTHTHTHTHTQSDRGKLSNLLQQNRILMLTTNTISISGWTCLYPFISTAGNIQANKQHTK